MKAELQLLAATLALSFLAGCDSGHNKATPEAACANNLRQIDGAMLSWAQDHHKTTNDVPTWADLQPYLGSTNLLCPSGGSYRITRVGWMPACSAPEHAHLARKLGGAASVPPP